MDYIAPDIRALIDSNNKDTKIEEEKRNDIERSRSRSIEGAREGSNEQARDNLVN